MITGFAVWLPMFLFPVIDWWHMRSWKEVPCALVRSPAGTGADHAPEISFRYELQGQSYLAFTAYDDGGATLPNNSFWTLRPGTRTVCYVDPKRPGKATLSRSLDPEVYYWCAPLAFVILPGIALAVGLRNIGRPAPARPEAVPSEQAGSIVLAPGQARGCGPFAQGATLIVLGALAALIVLLPGWKETWAARTFYLFFPTVGIVLLLRSLGYLILSAGNPRVTLTVTPGQGSPGETLEVRWETRGSSDRARAFKITLQGREELRYSAGRTTRLDTAPFADLGVTEGHGKDLRRGSAQVILPSPAMHSLTHGSRSIRWAFRLSCDIAFWPDLREEYPYQVIPRKGSRS